ncbi:DNRLRE domain-containing protein [Cytophaga aurantiaca]|uniref:DNRLRE domain-containing protein n=1 Tax=Cytophaga aurantiaca TaxID=29530 RepID=UPI00036550F4|nr:DNRLRE domain-containing protein [Cytophaga aurantiaca]
MKKITLAFFVVITLCISCSKPKGASASSGNTVMLYSYESSRGDAVFSRIVPNNNGGLAEDIHLYAWTQNDILNINRVTLDFNTSNISQNVKIKSAYLNLYFNPTSKYDKVLPGDGNSGNVGFMIEQITSEWNETTVTWKTQPEATAVDRVLVEKKTDAKANYLKLDVTKLVQNMINKPTDERFGFLLKLAKEEPYNVYFFASGNHPEVSIRPSLQITY